MRHGKKRILPLLGLGILLSILLTPTKAGAPPLPEDIPAPVEIRTVPEPSAEPEPEPPPQAIIPAAQDPVDDTYFEDAVFLGDSRTEGLFIYGGPSSARYLFAVGATVESVFTKAVEREDGTKAPLLDTLAEIDCSKIYVMLGVNELGWPQAEMYREQSRKLVDRLREDHPEAVVVLQSILPVSAKQEAKKTYVNNSRIAEYNQILREVADEKACVWLDVGAAVADEEGFLPADITSDGVHLNIKGCGIWNEYLQTHPVT